MFLATALLVVVASCGRGASDGSSDATTTTSEDTTSTTQTTVVTTSTTAKPVEEKERRCATAPNEGAKPAPDDWANYWQTQPDANQPLVLQICLDDVTPAAGQKVTLTVTADDPDASIGEGDCDIYLSWVTSPGNLCRDTIVATTSPEPTPAKAHGHVVKNYTYSYTKAQTYLVFVEAWSSQHSGRRHPYASHAETSLHVTVHP